MAFTLSQMRNVLGTDLTSATVQADSVRQGAQSSEKLTGIAVLVLLLLVLAITLVMARSMILPLRRLRADALDVAGSRLPEMVRRLSESDEADQGVHVEPIDIDSTDEIGEVARAFDQVHSEAARLAGEEAMLRANLNAMFVNLSRRSQTLIERQLGIIETLEQSEQDASRLSSLFRLDHLATRMRRNSENLLVLAGHEAPRKWTQPVALLDVLRAAISEIEQYDRITLNVQAQLVIAGRAASDVVHLVAELVENATTFSRKETQVLVTGQLLSTGGVLIDVTDEGLGIPEQELGYANWRLDNPPVIDVAVSRRMGLFVVGRLAARHGIKVRLRRAQSAGLSALIWVPESVAETEPTTPVGFRRRFGTGGQVVLSDAAIADGAPAMAGARTPVLGVRTARTKSIWFDTGEPGDDEQSPAPAAPGGPFTRPATGPTTGPALGAQQGQPGTVMVVPPTAAEQEPVDDAPDGRLPIYDSIESEWFRRGTTSFSPSPADEGFRAAQTVVSPVAGELTNAGLPRRVPSANLVPGSVAPRPAREGGGRATEQAPPPLGQRNRSPEAVRARLAGFQARGREGRSNGPQRPGTNRRPGTDED
jgi:signal transduction histidine kinase